MREFRHCRNRPSHSTTGLCSPKNHCASNRPLVEPSHHRFFRTLRAMRRCRIVRGSIDMQATAKTLGWDRSTVTQRLKGLAAPDEEEAAPDAPSSAIRQCSAKSWADHHSHLMSVIESFANDRSSPRLQTAIQKPPDRHFSSVETLVRQYFRSGRADISRIEKRFLTSFSLLNKLNRRTQGQTLHREHPRSGHRETWARNSRAKQCASRPHCLERSAQSAYADEETPSVDLQSTAQ